MQLATLEQVEQATDTNDPTHIWHVICGVCWPDRDAPAVAMCGLERPTAPARDDRPETVCVVCDELRPKVCGVCGS